MNIFRKLLIEKLEQNGGYSSGYHDRYAIEYEVGLYYVDTDIDHLAKVAAEHHGLDLKLFELVRDDIDWDYDQQWRWAQETMASHLNDSDCYSSYGTDTAKMFGLPYKRFPLQYKRRTDEMAYYPAAKRHWLLVDPYINRHFEVKFGLAGRGGKHLVITEFEGYELNISNRELIDRLEHNEEGYNYTNKWCQALLAMMHEWEKCFTSKIASEELEWYMADQLAQKVEDYVEEPEFAGMVWAQRQNLGATT